MHLPESLRKLCLVEAGLVGCERSVKVFLRHPQVERLFLLLRSVIGRRLPPIKRMLRLERGLGQRW